jgi:1-acyl-sn-glycerol-3-phosphate acyltransferase
MKRELRKIPALGIGCEKLGHIFIDRSNHQAAVASIQSARDQIRDGTSVIFFAEGTRSRDGRLRPFKKGAFRMALDLGLPILPVTIVGTRDILPPHSRDLMPGRAQLIIHPAVPVDGIGDSDVVDLMEQVRSIVAEPLSSFHQSD